MAVLGKNKLTYRSFQGIRSQDRGNKSPAEPERSVSYDLIRGLSDLGIEYVFMNSGTDYAPVIEAFSQYSQSGERSVEPVVVPHEGPAVGMAIGYYMVSGKPQAVMVHTTPGTANSLSNILNAQSMNIPLILIAGRTPVTEKNIFGGKEIAVHWNQELRDQAEMLRQFTKWDWEHRFNEQLGQELSRAYEVAMSDPKGPVYLVLPRERISEPSLQEGIVVNPSIVEPTLPDPERIREIAKLLADSENPMIITNQLARNKDAPKHLIELAESMSVPVAQSFFYLNFPTSHPMYIGSIGGRNFTEHLKKADLILLLDVEVPWFPKNAEPSQDAKVIHVDIDPLKLRMPTWGFKSDLRIQANTEVFLKLLNVELNSLNSGESTIQEKILKRGKLISTEHNEMVAQYEKEAIEHRNDNPIDPRWVSHCIGSLIDHNTLFFTETVRSPFYEHVSFNKPGMSFSTPPFGSLGWSMGAALGAKLAQPEKDVLVLLGDGTYMYNAPVASHYVSRARNLPIMTVVYNNQRWLASRGPVAKMYPNGTAVRTNNFPGTELDPSPDFEFVARSSGAYSRKVTEPEDVMPALQESFEYMRRKNEQVLLNIILKHP